MKQQPIMSNQSIILDPVCIVEGQRIELTGQAGTASTTLLFSSPESQEQFSRLMVLWLKEREKR